MRNPRITPACESKPCSPTQQVWQTARFPFLFWFSSDGKYSICRKTREIHWRNLQWVQHDSWVWLLIKLLQSSHHAFVPQTERIFTSVCSSRIGRCSFFLYHSLRQSVRPWPLLYTLVLQLTSFNNTLSSHCLSVWPSSLGCYEKCFGYTSIKRLGCKSIMWQVAASGAISLIVQFYIIATLNTVVIVLVGHFIQIFWQQPFFVLVLEFTSWSRSEMFWCAQSRRLPFVGNCKCKWCDHDVGFWSCHCQAHVSNQGHGVSKTQAESKPI